MTSKFPSVHFMSLGAREVAKKRGLNEVLFLEWDFGNLDYGPIAARIKDAKPDFIWVGAHRPRGQPAARGAEQDRLHAAGAFLHVPGARPDVEVAAREERAVDDPLRGASALLQCTGRGGIHQLYHERAAKAGIPDTSVEVQAAASYTAWQILEAGVKGAGSLDDKAIAAYIKKNRIDTIQGKLRFDGPSNYGDDLMRVKQVQNGRWVTVYPKDTQPRARRCWCSEGGKSGSANRGLNRCQRCISARDFPVPTLVARLSTNKEAMMLR